MTVFKGSPDPIICILKSMSGRNGSDIERPLILNDVISNRSLRIFLDAPRWVDNFIMLIFGGLPWQAYFQRVLSANSANNARIQSVCAGFACMFMAIPSIFIGAAAKATDWDLIFAQEANETGRPPMKILVSKLSCPSILKLLRIRRGLSSGSRNHRHSIR